jgi:hypothetical protein
VAVISPDIFCLDHRWQQGVFREHIASLVVTISLSLSVSQVFSNQTIHHTLSIQYTPCYPIPPRTILSDLITFHCKPPSATMYHPKPPHTTLYHLLPFRATNITSYHLYVSNLVTNCIITSHIDSYQPIPSDPIPSHVSRI